MTTQPNIKLSLPERLRLKKSLSRWMSAPHVFQKELENAQAAINQVEANPGWVIVVDRHGIPSAQPPANLRLTAREQKRFAARLSNSTEEERKAFLAAMGAAKFRGFQIGVSADGTMTATPPKSKHKAITPDLAAQNLAMKKFQKTYFGSSAFK